MKKTPKLRFPEFSGEWKEKKLGDLLEFKNGINASKEQYGKGIKFINVLDILNNDYITYNKIIGKVDIDKQTLENNSVDYGDVLFQRSSETREEVGTANVYLDKEKKATFGGFIIRGKKIGIYNPVFINKLLKTKMARKEITARSGGSTRYNVGQEILKDIELLFPSMEEQQKISRFFSIIDKKIEKQKEKVEALEEYKKGIMQKIFSQEIRFMEENGEEYPKWKEKRLKECINNFGGTALESLVVENGYYKFISIGNYDKSGNYVDNGQRINAIGKAEEKILDKNDLVMVLNDKTSTGDIIGSTILIDEDNKYIYNQRSERLKCNEGIIPRYLWLTLNSTSFRKKVFSITQGGTQIYVNFPSVKELTILIPCIQEQEKISNFLSNINEKFAKEQEKLEQLKELKKGLLQQMFV